MENFKMVKMTGRRAVGITIGALLVLQYFLSQSVGGNAFLLALGIVILSYNIAGFLWPKQDAEMSRFKKFLIWVMIPLVLAAIIAVGIGVYDYEKEVSGTDRSVFGNPSCSSVLSNLNSNDKEARDFSTKVVEINIRRKLGLPEDVPIDPKAYSEQTQALISLCNTKPNTPMRDVSGIFQQGKQ